MLALLSSHGMLQASLFYYFCFVNLAASLHVVNLAGILSSPEQESFFKDAVSKLRDKPWILPSVWFNSTTFIMDVNPVHAAMLICEVVMKEQVSAIVVSHPPNLDNSPESLSYMAAFYKIPVLGIASREEALSDKTVHKTFLRTVPPWSKQADVWMSLCEYFQWTQVVFIHSSAEEGWAMLAQFQAATKKKRLKIEKIIKYMPGLLNYTQEMKVIQSLTSRVILLYAVKEDAERIFAASLAYNMLSYSFAWIVTEQALEAYNVPLGTLGAHLLNGTNELAHLQDAVTLLSQGFNQLLRKENISSPPTSCHNVSMKWSSGELVYKYLRSEKLEHGMTGQVMFDENGDRLESVYEIINIHQHGKEVVGIYGSTRPIKKPLYIMERKLIFPGNTTHQPKGINIKTHLKVVTMTERPFVYATETLSSDDCDSNDNKIYCPRFNSSTGEIKKFCCYGYVIDLLALLSKGVNFTYDLHLVEDEFYGTFDMHNNSKKTWNGMMGELVYGKSDMVMATLTINPERTKFISFTTPYKFHGLTILVKKTIRQSSLTSFLQPFENTLWILIGVAVHIVALALYLLDRFSPFGRFRVSKSEETEDDALNLSTAIWFSWGVLFNSGIGEGTPRSLSARVLGTVWAGFAMIIIASYTANLAAFLVLDRPEASISGIEDTRLRNPQDNFRFATVNNSAVDTHFKRRMELSEMYHTMKPRNYNNADDAIEDVKLGNLHAFIWDAARLEFEAASECDLVTAGEVFGRSSYGIGLKERSPWQHIMSNAIHRFMKDGEMEDLDTKWILSAKSDHCPERESVPTTLKLNNMAGVFMMVAAGTVVGIILIFVEIGYKQHRGLKDKELELARNAADRWRSNIQKRRQRRQKQMVDQLKRNSFSAGSLIRFDPTSTQSTMQSGIVSMSSASSRIPGGGRVAPIGIPSRSLQTQGSKDSSGGGSFRGIGSCDGGGRIGGMDGSGNVGGTKPPPSFEEAVSYPGVGITQTPNRVNLRIGNCDNMCQNTTV